MTKTRTLVSPYIPRAGQQALHDSPARFKVIVTHRRWGKSIWGVNQLIRSALKNPLNRPQYAYLAPTMKQAKKLVWKYFKEYCEFLGSVQFNESELRIDFPDRLINGKKVVGATIYVLGAEDPESLRGLYLDGVVMDEYKDMPEDIWDEVLYPTLIDRDGWAVFMGTIKGAYGFWETYLDARDSTDKDWAAFLFKASESGVFSAEKLEKIKETYVRRGKYEKYLQEYECDPFVSVTGTFYSDSIQRMRQEGDIGAFSHDPKHTVITAWDLGKTDKTCIWFAQRRDDKIVLIDYYENKNIADLSHYFNVVLGKPYTYEYHVVPHDIAQYHLGMTRSRAQQFTDAGLKIITAPKLPEWDGIAAIRAFLPLCQFNESKCKEGIKALEYCHAETNRNTGVQDTKPKHDWSLDACKAFQYLATGLKRDRKPVTNRTAYSTYDMFNPDNQQTYQEFDIFDKD